MYNAHDEQDRYMTGIMTDIKGDGHHLTAPRLSGGWIIYAVVAMTLLLAIFGVAVWIFGKAKSAVGGKSTTGTGSATLADQSGMGSGMAGYL